MSIFNFNSYSSQSQMINGFLLLEISLTLSIMMILSACICTWFNKIHEEHIFLDKEIKALNLACNIIECYRSNKNLDKDLYKDSHVDIKITKDNNIDSNISNFFWITITVYLDQNNYKSNRKIILKSGIIKNKYI